MKVLTVTGLTRRHGDRVLFHELAFSLARGDRLVVVGPNGTGKSTLLRILAGREAADAGSVAWARGTRVGYLPQEVGEGLAFHPERPVLAVAAEPLAALDAMQARLNELEVQMGHVGPERLADCLREYGQLAERFEDAGGYSRRARVRSVLLGLGFRDSELDLPSGRLSGGQRTRLGLAQLLVAEPDLMLLDEPTNHLDLEATAWLEDYLAATDATLVLVAHDRRLLDRLATAVLELEGGRAAIYRGGYGDYCAQARARKVAEEKTARARTREVARLQAYVNRYRAGSRARQARSRQKAIERLEPAAVPVRASSRPAIGLAAGRRSNRLVMQARSLAGGYPGKVLFSGLDLELRREDRLGVVGPNGSGKTTLLRVLLGLQPPLAGSVRWGEGVEVAYFAQAPELERAGTDGHTALEEFCNRTGMLPGQARSYLARYGLRGETPLREVTALSGGERTRLRLAELVAGRPNVLVLDEPTHHLDLAAREALVEALEGYDGTLILVTHDRYLLERLVGRVLELKEGRVTLLETEFADYRARLTGEPPTPVAPARRPGRRPARRSGDHLRAIEEAIGSLEQRKAYLEDLLASPDTYRGPEPGAVAREYREVTERLEALYRTWERLAEAE